MKVTIATTQNTTVFSGEVEQIILPTETGSQTIYKNHIPVVLRLVPGIIKILPLAYAQENLIEAIRSLSISKGIAFVDSQNIRITVSMATTNSPGKLAELYANRSLLEKQLRKLKRVGNIEDIHRVILQLEKIKADINLTEMKV